MPERPPSAAHTAGVLTVLTMSAQVAYPLVPAGARPALTVAIVVVFAAASLAHAATNRGPRCAVAVLAGTAIVGFAAEVLGVHTGVPFGRYEYTGGLGPQVAGVPVVIALAWTMFAWPAAVVAHRLAHSFTRRVVVNAWALAAWDLYLDPQMVAAGRWRWASPEPHLPGVPTVPLSDYAGWLAVAAVISVVLQVVIARSGPARTDDRWPYALFLWTWASSTLALGAFWHLVAAAAWGAAGLGLVAAPLAWRLLARSSGTATPARAATPRSSPLASPWRSSS